MAMEWLAKDTRAPIATVHGRGPLPLVEGISAQIADETGRRLILSGSFDPHITSSLLKTFLPICTHDSLKNHMIDHIAEGRTFEGVCLSW